MVFQEEKFTPEIFHPKGANLTSSTLTSSWNVSSAAHHESNVSAMVVPEGCLVLQFSDYLPWDNPKSYISLHTELISYRIKVGLLMPICFFFGAPANIVNMMAFYRQGLKERINLCLFSQSLVDFLYLVNCMARYGERLPTQLFEDDRFGPVLLFFHKYHLNGFYGFSWASQFMSVVIAMERCFCIISPLRSQTVLKTKSMFYIIVISFALLIGGVFIVMMKWDVMCLYDPLTNTTSTSPIFGGRFYFDNKMLVDVFDNTIYGTLLPGIFMIMVVSTTIVTGVKLHLVLKWRTKTSSSTSSARELALTRMLICTSIFFIFCFFPYFLLCAARIFLSDLSIGGYNQNLFFFATSVSESMSFVHSSFHFVVYVSAGSRFRETLWELVGRKRRSLSKTISTMSSVK